MKGRKELTAGGCGIGHSSRSYKTEPVNITNFLLYHIMLFS